MAGIDGGLHLPCPQIGNTAGGARHAAPENAQERESGDSRRAGEAVGDLQRLQPARYQGSGILMVAFASGGRRRSGIAGLRKEQLTVEPAIEVDDSPPLPSLAIHLGRTKTSGADQDEVVYLTARPVEALNAWLDATNIDKQRVAMAGLEPRDISAHGLWSGF
jgi:hypothetical protein